MKYFTSDLHIGDPRIGTNNPNVFMRPFKTQSEQNGTILDNMSMITPDDELYVVGDVVYDLSFISELSKLPKCKKVLILGNYDDDKIIYLSSYFDEIYNELTIQIGDHEFYLNHYPLKVRDWLDENTNVFGITGHVHGLWKVKPRMVNVSTDAWHFRPVSETEILFVKNAVENYYDKNIFF